LGVPDDIGRVQGIPAVKKVKNHCSSVTLGVLPEFKCFINCWFLSFCLIRETEGR